MHNRFSRRDFLKLGGLSIASLAFGQFSPNFTNFEDSSLVRVAASSVSVYNAPSDKSTITGTWYKDDLIHAYEEITADAPKLNPIWYRVWGGWVWRARLQRVQTILNLPLVSIPAGTRILTEVTVPFTQPWRHTTIYGWQQLNFRLYYESTYWIEAVENGPDGQPWYRVFDDLAGIYYVNSLHLREISAESFLPISPEISWENKRIDVNLTTQILTAYELDKAVFQTNISSGLQYGNHTATPTGEFHIQEKMSSKHMGNGNLFAGAEDYELPGVPWTAFFTEAGHAFHGTYWHENFGTPMSHGCINMRTSEAKWLFAWTRPLTDALDPAKNYDIRGGNGGTTVTVHN
jgi:L,D-transpeptidase catalytic domain